MEGGCYPLVPVFVPIELGRGTADPRPGGTVGPGARVVTGDVAGREGGFESVFGSPLRALPLLRGVRVRFRLNPSESPWIQRLVQAEGLSSQNTARNVL